jgi:hypothetical protein
MAMPEEFTDELSNDRSLRDISMFEPPSYNISHGPDKALQWDPPADSDELAIALSYHFPIQKTLKQKMQAAVEKFLLENGPGQLKCAKAIRCQNKKSPRDTTSAAIAIPGLLSFNAETLEEVKTKRRRRAYEEVERVEVVSNRGMACELHRRQKVKVCVHRLKSIIFTIAHSSKCDPTKCLRNGQFQRNRANFRFTEHSNQTPNDTSQLYQGSIAESSSPQESTVVGESSNTSPPSNTNYSTSGVVASRSDSACQLASKEILSAPEHISQFMGFQADYSAIDDPFGFSLDPPFFLGHMSDTNAHHSWKSDEFLLSIMRDSMYV